MQTLPFSHTLNHKNKNPHSLKEFLLILYNISLKARLFMMITTVIIIIVTIICIVMTVVTSFTYLVFLSIVFIISIIIITIIINMILLLFECSPFICLILLLLYHKHYTLHVSVYTLYVIHCIWLLYYITCIQHMFCLIWYTLNTVHFIYCIYDIAYTVSYKL